MIIVLGDICDVLDILSNIHLRYFQYFVLHIACLVHIHGQNLIRAIESVASICQHHNCHMPSLVSTQLSSKHSQIEREKTRLINKNKCIYYGGITRKHRINISIAIIYGPSVAC